MIPEIGNYALMLALCLALVQGVVPLVGAFRNDPRAMALARPAASGQFVMVTLAFACLVWSFISNDFSVQYVASNSNSALPVYYRIAGTWGGHEGSLLLWTEMLVLWTFGVSCFSRQLPDATVARVLAVMGLISVGFLCFMLLTSNPFDRLLPGAADGRDLNPLLQDFGMIIHPPMLYMGYVGFSVAFAFAIAALMSGQLDAAWARWSRPWTLVAWMFLTLGIFMGSFWAYYGLGRLVVLGRGGKRFFHALAGGHGAGALAGGDGEAGQFQELDRAAGHHCFLAVAAGDLPGALRRADVGACVRHRSAPRPVHPGLPGGGDRRFAHAVRLARAESGAGRSLRAVLARVHAAGQ
jgi:ABC-type amino acid transport substrate-binding protein